MLTALSIAVSVFLVAILQSLLVTLNDLSTNPDGGFRFVVQEKASFTNVLPMSYEAYLKAQPEVEAVCGLQWFGGEYKDPKNFFANFATDEQTLFQVFKEETAEVPESQRKDFIRDGNGCVVGQALADKFGWKLGDVIPLKGMIFPVNPRLNLRAIFKGKRQSDEMVLHFHLKILQEGVGFMKGRVGSFWVRARRMEDIPKLCERIDRHYANSSVETLSLTENAFNLNMMKMLGDYSSMIHAISLAVLVAILIVTANTMALAIRERTAEIAVLRSLGFPRSTVLAMLLTEGLLLSLLGGALGIGLALLSAAGFRSVMGEFLPWMADFFVKAQTLAHCLSITLAIGLISTFVPAYRASRRPVTEGLRAL